jgi:hypothetical protein
VERPRSESASLIELPKVPDRRGSLTFIEGGEHIPFKIARAYWIYDVPAGKVRGGHAYRELEEVVVALSGSFQVVVDEGDGPRRFFLNRSYFGFYLPRLAWRQLEDFSTNSVCLILASRPYEPADYVRDHQEFLRLASEKSAR